MVVFAGPNGSGKSTITAIFQEAGNIPENYINPDEIALTLQEENPTRKAYLAAVIAEERRAQFINNRESFAFETVMSHPSKLEVMKQAKNADYQVELVFIATSDPEINVNRVRQRVAEGGHDVPANKIRERYNRTIELLPAAAEIADKTYIFDNTQVPKQEAEIENGEITYQSDNMPEWVQTSILKFSQRREERTLITETARTRELTVNAANINSGKYVGTVNQVTDNYIVQQVNSNLVLHDRSIVKGEFTPEQDIRITYRDGNVAATVQPNLENQQWAESILPTASGVFAAATQTNRISNPSRGIEVAEGNTYNLQLNRNTETLSIISKSDNREVASYDLLSRTVIASNPTPQDKQYWLELALTQTNQQTNRPDIEL